MTGINKKRLLVWGVIFAIFLIIGGGGFALNYLGYGNSGKVRTEVNSYVDRFNNLSQVKNLNNIEGRKVKANLTDSGISVNYKNNAINFTVNFEYKEESGVKYLDTVYNSNDPAQEDVVKLMIDAVGVENGNIEGTIFKTFEYSDFYTTQLAQGIKLKKINNNVNAKINLKANILAISDSGSGSEETITYILVDDTSKNVSDYLTYTVPSKFTQTGNKYEFSTDNNTCTATFRILSNETAANTSELVDKITKADNTTSVTQSINGTEWNKIVTPSTQGGQTNRFIVDSSDGLILLFDYTSMYGNNECDEYLDTILNTIKMK